MATKFNIVPKIHRTHTYFANYEMRIHEAQVALFAVAHKF